METDDTIKELVNKEYGPRPSSVTPVPSDDELRELLARVADSKTKGLSWIGIDPEGSYHEFASRLERLGYKLREGNDCWMWNGAVSDRGNRPAFREKTAYLSTYAALQNAPYETSSTFDIDHRCGNSLCVRPGVGQAEPNLRRIHAKASQGDGVRPKRPRGAPKPSA